MTPKEYHALSNREKDALVAEHVMGLVLKKKCWCDNGYEGQDKCPRCNWQYPDKKTKGWIFNKPEPYTTDITASWEVVEKITQDTKTHHFSLTIINHPYDEVSVEIEKQWKCDLEFDGEWEAIAKTVPEAICEASLKTVGVIHEN